jgi:MoaA/NifB/PqqE/SkfB family radical SAM enzyme
MRVTISGGEPLCHSEILPILSMIRCFDIDFSLITNAVGLTDTIVERLSTIANLRSVTVSIDGASAETNDLVRGEGAFVRAIAGLRRLIRTYKGTIAVRTTLMRTNFDSMEDLAALVAQFGVTEIKANRMNPYGRGASHPDLLLSDATYHAARDVLLKAAALHGLRVEIPSQKYQVDVDGRLGLCRAGEETFQIDADGSVYPCSFTFGGLLCGNVVSDSFGDILTRLQTHSINNQHCYSCRGRGGSGEKPVGYVPQLMVRSGQESSQEQ